MFDLRYEFALLCANCHIIRNRIGATIVNRIWEKLPNPEFRRWFLQNVPPYLRDCNVYIHYNLESDNFGPGV